MAPRGSAGECPICCQAFTKQQRREVQCGYCQTSCCAACLQQYLLGLAGDAHCMTCKRVFDGEFLGMHLPKTWLLTKYREHREKVLLDRELALMPDSQQLLANYRLAQRVEKDVVLAEQEKRRLQHRVQDIIADITRKRAWLDRVKRSDYTRAPDPDARGGGNGGNGNGNGAAGSSVQQQQKQRRQFIRACPVEGCRGYLSTAWKCGTCETRVCRRCGEPKGQAKPPGQDAADDDDEGHARKAKGKRPRDDDSDGDWDSDGDGEHGGDGQGDGDGHVCDPDVAASHALLLRDSRPCPKCAAMIYKISGCDQMWCTQCSVAFSWRTGVVVTNGVIHNPHYYEWMRRTRGEVPRHPDDPAPGAGGCGGGDGGGGGGNRGLPSLYDVNAALARLRASLRLQNRVRGLYRLLSHSALVDLPRLRRESDVGTGFRRNADLRLAYLLNQIGRDNMSRKLQQREKKRERAFHECQVFDMFCTAGTDTLREMMQGLKSPEDAADELSALLAFANDSLLDISKRYNVLTKKIGQ
jgi:hypothetical protein